MIEERSCHFLLLCSFVTDSVNSWLVWLSIGVTFACVIALVCCPGVRRKSPGNFICLFMFTGNITSS